MRQKRILTGLLLICVIVFAGFLTMLVKTLIPYQEADGVYEEISRDSVQIAASESRKESSNQEQGQVMSEICPITVDFQVLKELNPDIVGWIYGENTKINYPVVQGKDNEYYLTRMPDQKENASGSIFMDCRNREISSLTNQILYGHHMKNGSMFAGLMKYKSQEYYKAHSYFFYLTEDKKYRLEILRGQVTTDASDFYRTEFSSEEDKEICVSRWNKASCLTPLFTEEVDAPLVTLSTCSYETADARFVLQGQLIEITDREKN